ncbi:TonB-dependent siderophore receptor [Morganella morganii subsp. sibonii]|uniref:TonB-dependent siderophore receptor n=1 Tax=Morganella morganii TaxID=582 RepID=UPI001364BE14|nr:TonB-dependent siderophore receptor [Morganella morganii]
MRRLLSSYPVVIQSVITSVFSVLFLSVPVVYAEAEDVVYVTAADDEHYEPRGYGALRQSAATKGSALLAETPQFVSVIRRDQLDTLPGESLSKALRYSAGVTSEKFGGFGNSIDFSKMRGFDADYYLDGLRVAGNSGIWGAQVDSWLLESVEAVHGPSSALYGQGGAGGVINMQSRLPQAEESHQIQFQSGNYDNNALRFDSTGALNEEETWLYRMTGSAASSGSQIENTKQSRYLIAPSVTWRPLNNLNWTVAGVYQHDPYTGYYNTLPAAALGLQPNSYGSLDRHRNYSNPDHEKSGRTQQSVTSLVNWQVSDSLTLKQNLRYTDVKSRVRRDFTRGFVQDNRLLTAVYQDSPSRARTLAADNQLIYKAVTGPVSHEILTGFDLQTGKLDKDWSGSQTVTFDPYSADYRPQFTPQMTSSTSTGQTYRRYGVYVQDHLRWQQWSLILSGRYDDSSLKTTNRLSGTTEKSDTSAYSHRAGLTYTFDSGFSPWISISDSFDPVLGTDADGNAFVPTESDQTEAGIKYLSDNGDIMASLAVYELTQKNVTTHNPKNPDYYNQTGKVRSRGLEFESRMAVTPSLNVMLGYAFTDNVITESDDSSVLNKRPVQVPRHSGSLWADYRFHGRYLDGALIGAGVRYLGATQGDNTNSFTVPAVWLGDLSLRYQMDALTPQLSGMELGVTISNITNTSYVAGCTSSTYCSIGNDRTVVATLNYFF